MSILLAWLLVNLSILSLAAIVAAVSRHILGRAEQRRLSQELDYSAQAAVHLARSRARWDYYDVNGNGNRWTGR